MIRTGVKIRLEPLGPYLVNRCCVGKILIYNTLLISCDGVGRVAKSDSWNLKKNIHGFAQLAKTK